MDEPRDISYGPKKGEEENIVHLASHKTFHSFHFTSQITGTHVAYLQVHNYTTYFDSLEPVLLAVLVAVNRKQLKETRKLYHQHQFMNNMNM